MGNNLSQKYRSINKDHFPNHMEIRLFNDESDIQVLSYEKTTWDVGGEEAGLRYGENPEQQAALYRLVGGNLSLGDVVSISPNNHLASLPELLQSGKHPGKINITDIDAALNILRYLTEKPASIIMKHNNPCGVAQAETLSESYQKAYLADRLAAFGGAVAVNRELDLSTAEQIMESYLEVVAAPDFESGVLDVLSKRKNLRVMKIRNIDRLQDFSSGRFLELKSLIDGGVVTQWSFEPQAKSYQDFLPAETEYRGKKYSVNRKPTQKELEDMYFGWMVEAGVTSNSVIFVKDGVTCGIGTGEQDRVGVAEIARDKAYRKLSDRLSWELFGKPFNLLDTDKMREEINGRVSAVNGGLEGSVMISDAFFPFRDGAEVGLREGVKAILQPGGSLRDFESIEACNEYGTSMMFTGQRSFRH